MIDHRAHARVLVDRPVGIVQSSGEVIHCRARDLSIGGIGFMCRYGADIGSQFDVFFTITSADLRLHRIEARIRVIYIHMGGGDYPFRIGAQFLNFSGDSREQLNNFLNERLR